jgi:hypothetical protein
MIRFLHNVVDLISCLDLENLKQFHEHINLKKKKSINVKNVY